MYNHFIIYSAEKGVIDIPKHAAGGENPQKLKWNRMLNYICPSEKALVVDVECK